ncbi:MAG TPA: hypothetical protein PL064_06900, partial [Thermogutta sp.]|nr:hypothetical protein [Thermogutta sp.]
ICVEKRLSAMPALLLHVRLSACWPRFRRLARRGGREITAAAGRYPLVHLRESEPKEASHTVGREAL